MATKISYVHKGQKHSITFPTKELAENYGKNIPNPKYEEVNTQVKKVVVKKVVVVQSAPYMMKKNAPKKYDKICKSCGKSMGSWCGFCLIVKS